MILHLNHNLGVVNQRWAWLAPSHSGACGPPIIFPRSAPDGALLQLLISAYFKSFSFCPPLTSVREINHLPMYFI